MSARQSGRGWGTTTYGNTSVGSAFRHLTLALSAPIPGTPLTTSAQRILGDDNRFGVRQKNQSLASLAYGF